MQCTPNMFSWTQEEVQSPSIWAWPVQTLVHLSVSEARSWADCSGWTERREALRSQGAEFAFLWLCWLFIYELLINCCVWVECVVQGRREKILWLWLPDSMFHNKSWKLRTRRAKRANHSSCLAVSRTVHFLFIRHKYKIMICWTKVLQTLPVQTDFQNKTRTTALFTPPILLVLSDCKHIYAQTPFPNNSTWDLPSVWRPTVDLVPSFRFRLSALSSLLAAPAAFGSLSRRSSLVCMDTRTHTHPRTLSTHSACRDWVRTSPCRYFSSARRHELVGGGMLQPRADQHVR